MSVAAPNVPPSRLRAAARRGFDLLAAASLLACLAVCGLWAASSLRPTSTVRETPNGALYQWESDAGSAVVYRLAPADGRVEWVRPGVRWARAGTVYIAGRLSGRRDWGLLILPYWLPALAAAVLPGIWLHRRARTATRQREADASLCRVCGATLDPLHAHCPTCGRATHAVTVRATG